MKKGTDTDISSFREAVKTVATAARKKAFRKGLPVAISKNGKVVFVYKDKKEVIADSFPGVNLE